MVSFAFRRNVSSRFGVPALLVTLIVLVAPNAARAAQDPPSPSARGGAAPVGASHLRIARDPETGGWKLAPLAMDETFRAEADMALNQSTAGLVTEALPDGGWTMDLQGRFQSYSLARYDAKGKPETTCDEDPLSLFEWLREIPGPVDVHGRPTR